VRQKRLGQSTFDLETGYTYEPVEFYPPDPYAGENYLDAPALDSAEPGLIQRFQDAAARFQAAYAEFSGTAPLTHDEAAEWGRIKSWADNVNATMQAIAGALAQGWDNAKSILGLSGARRSVKRLGRLGAVPLLGWAAITGAIAALLAVTNSMMSWLAKNRRTQALFDVNLQRAQEGQAPVAVPGAGEPTTILEDVGELAKWIVLGLVIVYAAPPIIRALERSRT